MNASTYKPLPEGGEFNWYKTKDGWALRTALWLPEAARHAVVLINGRGDFIEKYAELIDDMLRAGFAVATLDWRGQGLSGRTTAVPYRTHLDSFDVLADDLAQVVQGNFKSRLESHTGAPVTLLAHSMGGLVAWLVLHDQPALFKRAVLLAPMCGVNTGPFSEKLARRMARLLVKAGQGERLAIGQMPYGPLFRTAWRQDRLTSDLQRFASETAAIDRNPALAIGGVTFSWLNAAFKAFERLESPGFAEAIVCPVRVFLADNEQLVNNPAAERFASRLPHCTLSTVPGARHEIFKERDELRSPVLAEAFAWLKHTDA